MHPGSLLNIGHGLANLLLVDACDRYFIFADLDLCAR